MKSTAFFAAICAAPLTAALLQQSSSGGALVINKCNFDIPYRNTPAVSANVKDETKNGPDTVLQAGNKGAASQFSTPWIQLPVGGWSCKLNTIGSWSNILQFEWTFALDNQVWYDVSFVDGTESQHPAWKFEVPDAPVLPHNKAYQYSTDDENGMQRPVSPSATVTLILCPENTGSSSPGGGYGAAPLPSSSAPAAPPATTLPPTLPPSSTSQSYAATSINLGLKQANVQEAPALKADPTTTSAPAANDPYIVTVYHTDIVTAVVTEIAHARKRRHEHRHPHHHAF